MAEQSVMEKLAAVGAILTNDHFVFTSGRHGSTYINKDAVYPHTSLTSELCHDIATRFRQKGIGAVIAPAVGGVILSTWIAHYLDNFIINHGIVEVLGLYADKEGDDFVIKRGYDAFIPGRKILVVEDVLTTGGSVKKVIDIVHALDGEVAGVGAICNRGGVTAEYLGVPEIYSLVNVDFDSNAEDECPLCKEGRPINTQVGKGREFLIRQGKFITL